MGMIDTAGLMILLEKLQMNIREYIERMYRYHKTKRGYTGDDQIDCTTCGARRGLLYRGTEFQGTITYWLCANLRCEYRIPDEFAPPSPKELEELFETLDKEKRRFAIMQFLVKVGFVAES